MALPHVVVRGGLVLAGALLIAMSSTLAPARAQGACAGALAEPTGDNADQIAKAVLCLVNEERVTRGLRPVEEDGRLLKAARRHSADMVRRRYFDHRSPEGDSMVERARATNYVSRDRRWRVAENLAWGSGSYGSARHLVDSWMASPPHRKNILREELRDGAVGGAEGSPRGQGGVTFTLLLGRR